jgi:hypothetical protein
MNRRKRIILGVVGIVSAVSLYVLWPRVPSVASEALDSADTFELMSIDPSPPEVPEPGDFHRFRVLGSTKIATAPARERLRRALDHGAEPFYVNGARCFDPRHGVRVTHAGVTTDFLICFECGWAQVYRGDACIARWVTDGSPQPEFDAALKAANITLAPPAGSEPATRP